MQLSNIYPTYFIITTSITLFCITSAEYGPFAIIPKEIFNCDELYGESSSIPDFLSNYKLRKVSRTSYTFSGKFTMPVDFTDDLSFHVEIQNWGNGGWRPSYMNVDVDKSCTASMTYSPDFYEKAIKAFNLTGCPVPAGVYEIEDFPTNKFKVSQGVSVFEYGKYRSFMTLKNGTEVIGCQGMISEVVPAKKTTAKKHG